MTQDMTPSKKLAMAALVAAIVGVIAFFMPMVSAFSVDVTGFDILDGDGTLAPYMTLGFGGAVVAAVLAAIGLSNRKLLNPAVAAATFSAAVVLMGFIIEEAMDYAGMGFWLFIIAEAACAIMSGMAANKAKTE